MSAVETLTRAGTETGVKTVWTIDPSHSGASFTVRHMFTKVRGRFTDLSGTIETEGDSLTDGQVSVEINADSVDTNDAQRDGHLRTNDFFGTGENPTITFRSTSVTPGATTSSWSRRPDDPRYHPPGHAGGGIRRWRQDAIRHRSRFLDRADGDRPQGLRPDLECAARGRRLSGRR